MIPLGLMILNGNFELLYYNNKAEMLFECKGKENMFKELSKCLNRY
jgi:hypothetical protein